LVRLERLAAEDRRELIALRVEDSGIGVSAADQARLFEPFEQAGDGNRRMDGTGLGLSICRRLADLMGGEIHMDSRLGAGTTMSLVVRLPVADAATLEPGAMLPDAVRTTPSVAEAAREGSLILLADDHPTNRAVIARQLNQLGYASESAHDGETALQMWRSGKYALLLTDLHMPRRDGYSLAEAVRADESARGGARAPIIALSANVSTGEVERSRAAGIDDFIAKPAPLQLLATALHRYLPIDEAAIARAPDAPVVSPQPLPAAARSAVPLDRELLHDFLDSTRQDLAALADALAQRDAMRVAREAHRIKGASGLVGADALAICADRIERTARALVLEGVAADVAELAAELERFAAAQAFEPSA
jgi:CheY-like chemotaxis protein/HPt (histidine-containing phosphotransfer) domain-containing protein